MYFLGTFTAGDSGRKFVESVGQVTFSGRYARQRGQRVFYITERAVLRLGEEGLELTELAPGADLERDVLAHMAFRPAMPRDPSPMDPRLFRPEKMGLKIDGERTTADRLEYHERENTLFVDLEGMRIATPGEVAALTRDLTAEFERIGRRFHVVVNYNRFSLAPEAADAYTALVRANSERWFLSSVRYATSAFVRRRLRARFEAAGAPPILDRPRY